jgi:hypothetical protein
LNCVRFSHIVFTVVELLCHSSRLRGLYPITKEQQPPKKCEISDQESKEYHLWFGETSLVEDEVVDESPPPNYNPPLTNPKEPILVQVRELFRSPFSLFRNPTNM